VQRNLSGLLSFVVIVFSFLTFSCTKIDTTTLGSDLIPAVDNVTTFADTLNINCTQGIFNDTITRVARTDLHVLGSISNDPVFGKTAADLYLELKPNFFPYYFGNAGDTINAAQIPGTGFDSVVLCLAVKSFYGDTNATQIFSVYQIDEQNSNFKDSSYKLDFLPVGGLPPLGPELGRDTVKYAGLWDYTKFYPGSVKDSVNHQIRIKLTYPAFLDMFTSVAGRDTSVSDNKYKSDSLFKQKMKGFAVVADRGQGNGLFYIDLNDPATRLEFHYKRNTVKENAYSSFYFSSGISTSASAHATHLDRDRSGAEVSTPQAGAVYIQTTPGTYANLSIPGLASLQNSIIHRAEIFVEQIAPSTPVDNVLAPPLYLYLDLIDTASGGPSKPIYFDLNPTTLYYPDNSISFFPTGGIDFTYFGGDRRIKDNGSGPLYYYTFNVSRYVQHIVTDHIYNYGMKLSAPFNLHYYGYSVGFRNNLANGRIKVGSGSNLTVDYRMKMRIVYSKL
jgi:Domain of unknown function (DUF4270)